MEVSDLGSEGGERGRVGIHLRVIRSESVKTVITLTRCPGLSGEICSAP